MFFNEQQELRRNVGIREILACIAVMICLAITGTESLASTLQETKRPLLWAIFMASFIIVRKGLCMPKSLQFSSIHRTVSENSVHAAKILSDAARASSAARLHQLSDAVKTLHWKSSDSSVAKKASTNTRTCTLSASESFVSRQLLAQLTLVDATTVFRYALECNDPDFDAQAFQKEQAPLMQQVLSAMDRAAGESRGQDDKVSCTTTGVDAIMFCAAVRIFAEWRILQVPEGYKGYEMGMTLGRRDLVQNVAKLETAAHAWMDDNNGGSPTIQQLLEHELNHGVHRQLPKLKEHTAAIAILWIKRQMDYQACVYTNMMQVPLVYKDAKDAVTCAYKQVYSCYHGWFVQKMFGQSFGGAPPVLEVYKFMNPRLVQELEESSNDSLQDDNVVPMLDTSFSSFDESSSDEEEDESWEVVEDDDDDDYHDGFEDVSGGCSLIGGGPLMKEWDRAGKHIQGEWEKFLRNAVELFQRPNQTRKSDSTTSKVEDKVSFVVISATSRRAAVFRGGASNNERVTKDAHEQIGVFLKTVRPVLTELSSLLEGLNMNDPTRV